MGNRLIITASKEQLKKEGLPESLSKQTVEFIPMYSTGETMYIRVYIDHFAKSSMDYAIMLRTGQHFTGMQISKSLIKII